MVKEGDLELAPDFQRKKVWGPVQKSRLIESILLRIPLPAFYFSSDEQGLLQVVDGLQRLSTINDFVNGKFVLNGLEYLQKDVGGKRFETLPANWSRRVYSTQIIANVVDPQTPDQVKFDIFKRINTGGSPLNAQEQKAVARVYSPTRISTGVPACNQRKTARSSKNGRP
jgi:uncharacterized protein with ParB-like and HNH nuclease domain